MLVNASAFLLHKIGASVHLPFQMLVTKKSFSMIRETASSESMGVGGRTFYVCSPSSVYRDVGQDEKNQI